MNEHELRLLVREAIARQLVGQAGAAAAGQGESSHSPGTTVSFARFLLPSGPEGSCIIEPAVACNHCGFCKSYGH